MVYDTINVTEAYKNCKNEQQFKMAWVSLDKRFWKNCGALRQKRLWQDFQMLKENELRY